MVRECRLSFLSRNPVRRHGVEAPCAGLALELALAGLPEREPAARPDLEGLVRVTQKFRSRLRWATWLAICRNTASRSSPRDSQK